MYKYRGQVLIQCRSFLPTITATRFILTVTQDSTKPAMSHLLGFGEDCNKLGLLPNVDDDVEIVVPRDDAVVAVGSDERAAIESVVDASALQCSGHCG